jgi:hypothetical protein
MKASELRIGNFINGIYYDYNIDDDHREKETICEVVTLDSVGSCEYPIWVESESNIETFSDFEPIPLTEEWLLKFDMELTDGFSSSRKLYLNNYENDISKITYSPKERLLRLSNGDTKGTMLIPHVKYVHQLQNLYFALTGEELTFKSE